MIKKLQHTSMNAIIYLYIVQIESYLFTMHSLIDKENESI